MQQCRRVNTRPDTHGDGVMLEGLVYISLVGECRCKFIMSVSAIRVKCNCPRQIVRCILRLALVVLIQPEAGDKGLFRLGGGLV